MPAFGTTIEELELDAVARIAALDGSAFNQGSTIIGSWTEATIPLSVEDEAAPLGHLLFNVWAESGRNTGLERDGADEFAKLATDLVVLFTYHIRPGSQIADQRKSSEAARRIVKALMAMPQSQIVYTLVNAFRPALTPDGEWMLVRVDFVALHDLPI